jgi:hypothetical protein
MPTLQSHARAPALSRASHPPRETRETNPRLTSLRPSHGVSREESQSVRRFNPGATGEGHENSEIHSLPHDSLPCLPVR